MVIMASQNDDNASQYGQAFLEEEEQAEELRMKSVNAATAASSEAHDANYNVGSADAALLWAEWVVHRLATAPLAANLEVDFLDGLRRKLR